ncbi:MAG: HEPN domain-containing protein [Candidatus Micrarchaeota archaeon]
MTFEECLEKGLIRKAENAPERVRQSISVADKFLKSAKRNLEMDENEVCEIIAYNSLFHYARALLFNKGCLERSHACLFLALKKFYPEQKELLEKADRIRLERHNLQYGGLASDEESALFVIEFVKEFGETAKELLKKT